jgi:hypothetical protein
MGRGYEGSPGPTHILSPDRERMPHMNRSPLIGLVLAIGLLLLTGCSTLPGDDGPHASRGDVVEAAGYRDIEGRHLSFTLPGLRYDFVVSSPRDRIDDLSATDASISPEAADGDAFVGVSWDLSAGPGDSFVYGIEEIAPRSLSLVVDGTSHAVGDLGDDGFFGAYVAVDAEADQVGLSLEYDGLTQTVDDVDDPVSDGTPDLLVHETPRHTWADCPDSTLGTTRAAPMTMIGNGCGLAYTSPLAYHAERGWAPAGKAWVIVDLSVHGFEGGYDAGAEYVTYEVVGSEQVDVRLDGRKPVQVLPFEDNTGFVDDTDTWQGRAIFEVDDTTKGGTISFRRAFTATPEDADEAKAVGAPRVWQRVYRASVEVG